MSKNSKTTLAEILLFTYLLPFQESVSELILNLGVRTNSVFLPQ